ncbi:hypothetical protein FRC07_012493 [Ceratobasidium sp. 392]|nr:hypothetical protein FRC07_012493 [Ceratobasidium sp. 392]
MATTALDALPSELQLCILQNFSTRSLLLYITRLSKHWFALSSGLVRHRAMHILTRPGVNISFEASNPSDYTTRTTYTLQPSASGLTLECGSSCFQMPQLSLGFSTSSPTFDFILDEDEYFGSLLWSVYLSTHRSIQCRVSPPASPRLVAFDRTVRYDQRVVEGMDRFRRSEFTGEKGEERELVGDRGPSVYLTAKLDAPCSVSSGEKGRVAEYGEKAVFKVGFESVRVDAASVVVASEDGTRGNDMTLLFCGR